EAAGGVEDPALPRGGGPDVVGIGVVEILDVPAAVGGELTDHIAPIGHHVPQVLWGVDTAGIAAAHADDRDRRAAFHLAQTPARVVQVDGHALQVVEQSL